MTLSRQDLVELKNMVDSRWLALDGEIRVEAARARDTSPAALPGGMDRGDVAVADQITDLASAELMRDVRELRELDAARARLAAGSYGLCVDCEQDVGYARLRAQPAASRCYECQSRYENTHAHPETPTL